MYVPGDTVIANVLIGTSSNMQTNFYGASFMIDYDETLTKGYGKIQFVNSWVGDIHQSKITFAHHEQSSGNERTIRYPPPYTI